MDTALMAGWRAIDSMDIGLAIAWPAATAIGRKESKSTLGSLMNFSTTLSINIGQITSHHIDAQRPDWFQKIQAAPRRRLHRGTARLLQAITASS
jgi:hypothetical protein